MHRPAPYDTIPPKLERTVASKRTRTPGGTRPRPNLELLKLRIQQGLSREELGRLAGLSGKQIGLIERGVAVHSREHNLKNVADALGVDVLELFDVTRRLR